MSHSVSLLSRPPCKYLHMATIMSMVMRPSKMDGGRPAALLCPLLVLEKTSVQEAAKLHMRSVWLLKEHEQTTLLL